MSKAIAQLLFVALVVLVSTSVCFAEHPAAGHPIAGHWVEGSEFPPPELSLGDLTFMPKSEYPDYDALTQLEQYMMFGVKSSSRNTNAGLPSWETTILSWAAKFYKEYGYVPEQLTGDVIRSIPSYSNMKDEWLSVEHNPLTGAWPRLTAGEHSPGDLYIRALTEDEIDYFVDHGYGYLRRPSGGNATRNTPVFYIRMYGYNCVLENGFTFFASLNQ